MDVPLGVPFAYLTAFDREGKPDTCRSFLGLLQATIDAPRFFDPTTQARDWEVRWPFFVVPKGPGGLTSFQAAAEGLASLLCSA